MNETATCAAPARRRFKPYPAYKDSGVEWLGEIPVGWETIPLKRAVDPCRPVTYGIVQCGPHHPDGIPYIRPVDMTDEGGVQVEALQRTTPEIAAAYSRSTVRPGDIVVSIGPSFGKAMIVPADLDGANLTQGTARVAPSRNVLARFLFWALRSESSRMAWDSLCAGATFRALTLEILETCEVALPASPEQRAIAAFLDRETARIDALVAKKERLIELLQEKRTALITRAVTKGLDPTVPMKDSGVEWLGEIPAHWETTFLDKLIDPLRRITYGIVQPGEPDPDGIPMVRGQNYSRGWSPLDEIFRVSPAIEAPYRRARLKPGDLVMTIVGAGTGNVAIVPEWLAEANLTQTTARIAVDGRKGNNRYFAYQLQSVVGTVSVELTVKGAAQPGLNLGHIAKFRVVVPPIPEQRRIAAFLDRETAKLDALIAKVREAIERLKELRTALISAAVTGKIDVREEAA